MQIDSKSILCDGCGLPASPVHIAERVGRLEVATRFRPIHTKALLIALSPEAGIENDFYGPPVATDVFDSVMNSVNIVRSPNVTAEAKPAMLLEFQREGFYLAYLSECPIPSTPQNTAEAISRLGANLIRRIRFNYKPKHIVLLGKELTPLIEILNGARLGPLTQVDRGETLHIPETKAAHSVDASAAS